MLEVSLSTMWAKGRFNGMSQFAAKAKELGFTHIEANASVSPQGLDELIKTSVPISSIHSPCPAVLSSKGTPVANLSLSSLDESEREEAVSFARKTIQLASTIRAKAVVLHMGEVPINLSLQDKLHQLYNENHTQTKEYSQAKDELIHQRASQVPPYLEAARKSLEELSQYSQQQGILLGLETRFYFHEIPNIDEMEILLNASCHSEPSSFVIAVSRSPERSEREEKQSHLAQDKPCSERSESIRKESVGYWHDVGHAEVNQRLGFTPHEEWLSRFNHKMIGVHLHDVIGISDHRPPGKGTVNWDMVAKYLPYEIIRTCEIAEWNEEEEIQGVVDFLQRKGLVDCLFCHPEPKP